MAEQNSNSTWEQELFEKQRERELNVDSFKSGSYCYAVNKIRSFFGLELTNTEKIHLSKIVKEVTAQVAGDDAETFDDIYLEAESRFFKDYFGINVIEYLGRYKNDHDEIRKKYRPDLGGVTNSKISTQEKAVRAKQLGEYIRRVVRPKLNS